MTTLFSQGFEQEQLSQPFEGRTKPSRQRSHQLSETLTELQFFYGSKISSYSTIWNDCSRGSPRMGRIKSKNGTMNF